MIYSRSRSSSELSKFWIQAKVPDPCTSGSNPCYLSIFGNCIQSHLKFNHKEVFTKYLPFSISYYSPIQYSKSKIQREITFLFICSFIFSWIRIQNNNSRSMQKFQIHANPDPQLWFYVSKIL